MWLFLVKIRLKKFTLYEFKIIHVNVNINMFIWHILVEQKEIFNV